jgi:hypothetical protein
MDRRAVPLSARRLIAGCGFSGIADFEGQLLAEDGEGGLDLWPRTVLCRVSTGAGEMRWDAPNPATPRIYIGVLPLTIFSIVIIPPLAQC